MDLNARFNETWLNMEWARTWHSRKNISLSRQLRSVDYGDLSVAISAKMTLNVIDIATSVTSLVGCNDRLEFIVIVIERLEMLLRRYDFD
jgi:hypothetical protein